MNDLADSRVLEETAAVQIAIGRRIRQLRIEQDLTLQALGDRVGLSPSMLSLLERGKTGPSIGTLVVIASALGTQMSDLLDFGTDEEVVLRAEQHPIYITSEGVERRILRHDRQREVEIAMNDYAEGTSNSPTPRGHEGYEYGVLLEGELTVMIGEESYQLSAGDTIAYESSRPHRIINSGKGHARTLWINLKRNRTGRVD